MNSIQANIYFQTVCKTEMTACQQRIMVDDGSLTNISVGVVGSNTKLLTGCIAVMKRFLRILFVRDSKHDHVRNVSMHDWTIVTMIGQLGCSEAVSQISWLLTNPHPHSSQL